MLAAIAVVSMLLAPNAVRAQNIDYMVTPGDTLWSISTRYLTDGPSRDNIAALAKLNRIDDPNRLQPGVQVQLPIALLRMTPGRAQIVETYGPACIDGKPASKGATIVEGNRLETDEFGGILVELADGSRIWIRGASSARIQRLKSAPDVGYADTGVQIESGRVETFVSKLRGQSRFEIRTPTAKLGVRGTQFRVWADADGGRAEVLEGQVVAEGSSARREIAVDAGFGVRVDSAGRAADPVKLLGAPPLDGVRELYERPLVRVPIGVVGGAPASGAAIYRGHVADANSGAIVASQVVNKAGASSISTEFRFPDLPDGRYNLTARARDRAGIEGFDATRTFTLKARPEPPFPSVPQAGSTLRGAAVQLAWSDAVGASGYRLQVATDSAFAQPLLDRADLNVARAELPLAPGDYFWRLATITTNAGRPDQGPFSDPVRFTLRALPDTPIPATPSISTDRVAFA